MVLRADWRLFWYTGYLAPKYSVLSKGINDILADFYDTDWFQSFKHTTDSLGAIYLTILMLSILISFHEREEAFISFIVRKVSFNPISG